MRGSIPSGRADEAEEVRERREVEVEWRVVEEDGPLTPDDHHREDAARGVQPRVPLSEQSVGEVCHSSEQSVGDDHHGEDAATQ